MEFSRPEYWSGLQFPSPGDLLNPVVKPRSPALQADTLLSEPPGKPGKTCIELAKHQIKDRRSLCGRVLGNKVSKEHLRWSTWSSSSLATWYEKPTHWKRPWCWKRLRAGEGNWLNEHKFEQTPGESGQRNLACCRMGSQRIRHDLVTEQQVMSYLFCCFLSILFVGQIFLLSF